MAAGECVFREARNVRGGADEATAARGTDGVYQVSVRKGTAGRPSRLKRPASGALRQA